MGFKLGMCIPPKIGEQGLEQAASWCAETGLEVLDVELISPEVKQICNASGIEIGSVDSIEMQRLLSRDELSRIHAVEAVKKQMSEMSELGARVLFMCLIPEDFSMPRMETFAIWKESFPELVRHAERVGVYIAIEGYPGRGPHYPAIGCTPEMWRPMFEAIPSKHFGLNYDPSHLVRLRIDYLRALSEFGERVIHCHGKDTEILHDELYEYGVLPATFGAKYRFSEGSWRYTIPGHGQVEWSKVAVLLDRIGYNGAICIELEDHRFCGTLENERQGIVKAAEHLALYFK